jgi:hypothetical protein
MIIQDLVLEEGVYKARIKAVHEGPMVKTRRGPCATIEIEFGLENMVGSLKRKKQRYLAFASNRALRQVFLSALGQYPTIMDANHLIGRSCLVEIKHNRSDSTGKLFANVAEVYPSESADGKDIKNPDYPIEGAVASATQQRKEISI